MTVMPWLNEKVYAPYKLAALVETVAAMGMDASAVLKGTGLGLADLEDPETRTSVAEYVTACRNVIAVKADPRVPFEVGSNMHLSAYGMYGYALLCSLTLRDFFSAGVKYHQLATPIVSIDWDEQPGAAVWRFVRVSCAEPGSDLYRFLMEQQLAQHVTHLKDVAGPDCRPVKVVVNYPAPAHAALYQTYLGCLAEFNGRACELHYDGAIIDKAPQQAHKLTSTQLRATCERLLTQVKTSSGLSGRIYQLFMENPGRFPSMSEVATLLHMNDRTLRRKLENEHTSFADITDDVRNSLAREYLKTTKLTTEDIAALVGFSDATNFRRAFKRWNGMSPKEFRE